MGQRLLAWVLTAGGAFGFLAAFTLTVEKIALLKDPSYSPSCSINPVLSCGSVMSTPQAAVFGFPNPLLGIAGFAVVTALGVVLLTGAVLPRWFWWGLSAGVTFGVVFIHWLIFQSLYRIGALCPYCMVVWTVMIPVFWYTALHVLTRGLLPVPDRLRRAARRVAGYHGVVLTCWYLLIGVLILQRFWLYWTTLV
ncbi:MULTISPECIES: vitamin K epoxide reductase family protein [Streptomyces]|uniref:Vitamin K epoxide reductase family protein n=1 Tax=Streptomyces plicatus TaxID=1922 RepID=A0ABW1Y4V7_STRPL|nr:MULTISPECIES: vitamin K epoxide reductase family protein [Streptomyces]RIH59453.1 Vitamin K epoxide reductase [Streptomyces sp. SHP22-7]RSS66413.1 vitamin K epoxide reductase family protein [Streptomyces sp. WAC06273]GGZ72418.1 membrane protein [Streptomyces plicatus]GHC28504.1 membrane protein [Streptomyces vinaceusdrappus]